MIKVIRFMMGNKIYLALIGIIMACMLTGCSYKKETDINNIDQLDESSESDLDTEISNDETDLVETKSGTDITSTANIEENLSMFIEDIGYWEYECLYWYYDDETEKTIDFTVDELEKARLATMTTPFNYEDTDDELIEILLPVSDVQNNAQKIFGSDVSIDALPLENSFAVKRIDEDTIRPVLYISQLEDEGLFEVINQEIVDTGDGYDIEQEIFCGYWGDYVENQGNYNVTFHLLKSEASHYGAVLTRMNFSKTGNNRQTFETSAAPFYGIWCCGVKEEKEANDIANDLLSKGVNAYVFITADWSNLNPERWYAVTAGIYNSEEEAEAALPLIQSIGYNDAYIKYSGDHR